MGIGQPIRSSMPCTRAVLARRAVQRVEDEIGLRRGKARGDVAAHVDPGDAVAERLERIGAPVPDRSDTGVRRTSRP